MPRTERERVEDWWAEWRNQNFTWEGLGDTDWDGWAVEPDGTVVPEDGSSADSRVATLQDYWRDEEPRLIEGPGGKYTRFHLPLTWSDGSPTPKTGWGPDMREELRLALRAKLDAAALAPAPDPEGGAPVGAGHAQFQGVVLPPQLPLSQVLARFVGPVRLQASFAWIEPGYFGGSFNSAPLRVEGANFYGAAFPAYAWWRNLQFVGETDFSSAIFVEGVSFGPLIPAPGQPAAEFVFDGPVHFESAQFLGRAVFSRTAFSEGVSFAETHFASEAFFRRAVFKEKLDDGEPVVEADFANARFGGGAYFAEAQFACPVDFQECMFAGRASFEKAEFKAQTRFRSATFERQVSFAGAVLPKDHDAYDELFRDTRFRDAVDLTVGDFGAIAALNETVFERPPVLDDPGLKSDAVFRAAIRAAERAVATKVKGAKWPHRQRTRRAATDRYFGALEGGCRVLKRQMEIRRARTLEQRYYHYELLARRRRPSTQTWERFASWVFEKTADYGDDFLRPLICLVMLAAACAVGYAVAAHDPTALLRPTAVFGKDFFDSDLVEATLFSGRNVFRPFSVWSGDPQVQGPWLTAFLDHSPGWARIGIRLVATLQSIASVILLFLSGLSLRRRFQVA